jgi:secreted trypsin-like serine protease
MVNPRRRAATLCCLATAAASSTDNIHGIPSIAVLNSSPLATSRRQNRRLGVTHSKGHSKGNVDDKPAVVPMSAVKEPEPEETHKEPEVEDEQEEQGMQFIMLGGSSGTDNIESVAVDTPTEDDEEPATDLSQYKMPRIGGSSAFLAQEDRYPYMASLQIEGASPNTGKFDYHMCGGFLIAPDLIMTSAHCADYSPPGSDETFQAFNGIEVGRVNLGQEETYDKFNSQTYHLEYENLIPENLIKHPKFDVTTYEHDLMIVKVFGKSRYPHVKVASHDDVGEEITLVGWGAESANSNKKYSDELREADMLIMTNEQCKNFNVEVTDPSSGVTTTTSLEDNIFDDMMCATAKDRYICHGDAGGPAIRRGSTPEEDVVSGIISWGYGCVNPNYPAVMTRTSEHYNWIRTIVCKESTDPPSEYGCAGGMSLNSAGGALQTVTLKMKLDMMAIETGFVIVTTPQPSVVAQRVPGYYKIKKNEIVEERMDLPSNQCYKLILLDSFGDGFCCDMGGGSGTLFLGTDTGYYTGRQLVKVSGKFDYDSQGEFCLDASSNVVGDNDGKSAVVGSSGGGTSSSSGGSSSSGSSGGSTSTSGGSSVGSKQDASTSYWTGPATSPEFEYCNQFCNDNSNALNCGSYTCHHAEESTSDSDESGSTGSESGSGSGGNSGSSEEEAGFVPEGDVSNPNEYYLTVKFQFDDHPQDVSWVLYDLTENEVKMFVDFDVYTEEEFAGQVLEVVANVDGPEGGEKQYAFTVYDKESDGLCCEHGEGYYQLFLGDVADNMELLGDSEYDFSSSYYFTLFEGGGTAEDMVTESEDAEATDGAKGSTEDAETDEPTGSPVVDSTASPTTPPTKSPSAPPTSPPTSHPTHSPTTPLPTFPWEIKRSELMEEIGARWNTASVAPPEGKFNDVGGDQRNFDFTVARSTSSAKGARIGLGVSALVVSCAFELL